MVFLTEAFLEVAIESWPEWDLNSQPLNSVQMLYICIMYIYNCNIGNCNAVMIANYVEDLYDNP